MLQQVAKFLTGSKKPDPSGDLKTLVYRRLDEGQKAKRELERVWFISMAFKEGSQWSSYDSSGRYLYLKELERDKVRLTSNRIHGLVQMFVAKLTKNNPAWFVMPASAEPKDEDAAELAEALLEYFRQELRIKRHTVSIFEWIGIAGKCFAHTYWDAKAGEPMAQEDGSILHEGNLKVEIVSPFEFIPDPLATTLEECRWVIRARTVYKEWVVDAYGLDEEDAAKIEEDVDAASFYRRSLGSIQGPVGRGGPDPDASGESSSTKTSESLTTLVEYFERPSVKHPKGRCAVFAGKRLLKEGPLPYDHGNLPFVEFGAPSTGKFWPSSMVEMSVPIQKELNRTRSQMLENQNMMANGKWIVERDSIEDVALVGKVGEVIQVKRGSTFQPHAAAMPGLPAYVTENIALSNQDLQEIWGQHEVTRATVPSGIRSGRAIAFLIEQDDTRLGPIVHQFEAGMEEWGSQLLALARQFYKERRMIQVIGADKEMLVKSVGGSDIAGNLTVRVQAGSAFPYSKAAKQDEIMELLQSGVLLPDAHREHILRALDVGNVDALVYRSEQDRNNARYENDQMKAGKAQVPAPFDDHAVHIDEHDYFRKSPDYRALPLKLKDLFDAHVVDHQQFIAAAAQLQAPPPAGPPMPMQPMGGEMGMDPSTMPESQVPETIQDVIEDTNAAG